MTKNSRNAPVLAGGVSFASRSGQIQRRSRACSALNNTSVSVTLLVIQQADGSPVPARQALDQGRLQDEGLCAMHGKRSGQMKVVFSSRRKPAPVMAMVVSLTPHIERPAHESFEIGTAFAFLGAGLHRRDSRRGHERFDVGAGEDHLCFEAVRVDLQCSCAQAGIVAMQHAGHADQATLPASSPSYTECLLRISLAADLLQSSGHLFQSAASRTREKLEAPRRARSQPYGKAHARAHPRSGL